MERQECGGVLVGKGFFLRHLVLVGGEKNDEICATYFLGWRSLEAALTLPGRFAEHWLLTALAKFSCV